jgi:DNA modification methylase
MCVTSPPYFGLRDYGVIGQLGLEKTPQLYVDAMVGVFAEVKRVLRDDGTLWLNIGDSYAGSWGNYGGQNRGNGTQRSITKGSSAPNPAYDGLEKYLPATANVQGCKPKDMIGIPWMLAFALRADGWYLRSDIIWHKPNPMPESVTDRPTKSHEYLFLLTKSPTYYYDADAIAEDSITDDPRRPYGSLGSWELDGRPVEQRPNGQPRKERPTWQERKTAGATAGNIGASDTYQNGVHGEGLSHDLGIGQTRNKRSVWTVSTQRYRDAHFATFPPKLIEPCILAGSAKGDTVLDPFGGAGTTGLVADRLGRNALLIELNPKYAEMARRRITDDAPLFHDPEAA